MRVNVRERSLESDASCVQLKLLCLLVGIPLNFLNKIPSIAVHAFK